VQIDDPTPPEQLKCTVRTFVRPLDKFPPTFEKRAKDNAKGSILPMQNERMLLNSLLSKPRASFFYELYFLILL
jgi:DNA polymerase alpha subunit A